MGKKLHWMFRLACCSPLLAGCAHLGIPETNGVGLKLVAVERSSGAKAEGALQLARYHLAANRLDQAIASYRQALAADPGLFEARNGLGVACAMQGRHEEAIAELRAAAAQAPQATHIPANLGYALYLKGDYDQAIAVLEQSLLRDPANARARNNLALSYAAIGSGRDAQAPFPAAAAPPEIKPLPLPQFADEVAASPLIVPPGRAQLVELTANVYEIREFTAPVVDAAMAEADIPVEVSNGNGVNRMARRVARYIDGSGYRALHRTNWKDFSQPITRVEYRVGYRTQARQLGMALPGNPPAALDSTLRPDVNIRIVLGKDMARHATAFRKPAKATLIARDAHGKGH